MKERRRHWTWLILATLALRVPLLWLSPGAPFDMDSYARAAACPGPGLYSSVGLAGHYPYLPLWWLLLKALAWLQGWLGGGFTVWARLPGVVGDGAVALWIYALVERRSRGSAALAAGADLGRGGRAGLMAGLGWALNPVAALLSAAHGQFDSLPLALLLGAAWGLEYAADARAEAWSAVALGAAIAFKTWPLALLPFYLGAFSGRRERVRFALWVLLPPLLLALPWAALDGFDALGQRLAYTGATALGLSGALRAAFFAATAPVELYQNVDDLWRALAVGGLALAFGAALWRCRRWRLLESLPWAALFLLLLAPGLSPQSMGWPIALALAVSPALAWRLTWLALPLLVGFYGLFMPAVLAGPWAWEAPRLGPLATLGWALLNLVWWVCCLLQWNRLTPRVLMPAGRRRL